MEELVDRIAERPRGRRWFKRLYRRLKKCWEESNARRIDELRANPIVDIHHLPGTVVEARGVMFFVHGIAHGQDRLGSSLSHATRSFVSSQLSGWTEEGSDYLLEPGFARLFGAPRSNEMKAFMPALLSLSRAGRAWWVVRLLLLIPLVPFLKPVVSALGKLGRLRSFDNIYKSLDDVSFLVSGREILRLSEMLPEPLNLQLKRERSIDGEFSVAYSKAMADIMLRHGVTASLHELHAVVGFAHESEIAYFLSAASEEVMR